MLDRLERRGRRALRRGPPAARPRGRRLRARRDAGPRPRLLHAHRLRVRLRPARRAVRRSAAAGATTGWSSSSAARRRRRRLGRRDRADPAGARARGRRSRASTSSSPPPTASASARSRWSSSCAAPASPPSSTSAGAVIKGQMKQADRLGAAHAVILDEDGDGAGARHGERRAARARPRRGPWRSSSAVSPTFPALRAERLPRHLVRPGARRPRRLRGARSPAGSTAAATTAGWSSSTCATAPGSSSSSSTPTRRREAHELGHKLRAEDVLSRRRPGGRARRRRPSTPTCRPARSSSASPRRTLLADAETPPFEIEGFSGEVGRGDAASLPLPRPAPRADARGDRAAPPGRRARSASSSTARASSRSRRRCSPARRPRARATSSSPVAPPAGLVLRAAAVAAALQAAADGRRLRALLPDRPLLSRRGPARRPPARLHPARRRDVVRRASRTCSTSTSACWRPCSRAVGGPQLELPLPRIPYDEAMAPLRHRPPGPALRPRARSTSPTCSPRPSSRSSAA